VDTCVFTQCPTYAGRSAGNAREHQPLRLRLIVSGRHKRLKLNGGGRPQRYSVSAPVLRSGRRQHQRHEALLAAFTDVPRDFTPDKPGDLAGSACRQEKKPGKGLRWRVERCGRSPEFLQLDIAQNPLANAVAHPWN
jgi:hypothetical protein